MKMYAVTRKSQTRHGHGMPSETAITLAVDGQGKPLPLYPTLEAAMDCADKLSQQPYGSMHRVTGLEVQNTQGDSDAATT